MILHAPVVEHDGGENEGGDDHGFGKFLFFLALISVNLGIFNLLPFPILDGGHLTFLAVEKIKGSPVSERFQYAAHVVAFVLLIGLAIFVTYNDVSSLGWLGR